MRMNVKHGCNHRCLLPNIDVNIPNKSNTKIKHLGFSRFLDGAEQMSKVEQNKCTVDLFVKGNAIMIHNFNCKALWRKAQNFKLVMLKHLFAVLKHLYAVLISQNSVRGMGCWLQNQHLEMKISTLDMLVSSTNNQENSWMILRSWHCERSSSSFACGAGDCGFGA